MIFWLVLYGTLAGFALWATWHDRHLRTVGAMLVIDYIISNMAWFSSNAHDRAGIYTMLEIMIVVTAYIAHSFCSSVRTHWLLRGVVAVSVVSICINIAFSSIMVPIPYQTYIYDIATNMCFAAECLLMITGGVLDGVGAGRFDHWSWHRRDHSRSHVRPSQRKEP